MATVREIITRALGELLYIAEGETPSATTMRDGLNSFNSLIASWHTQGMLIGFPAGTNWKADWTVNTAYSVNDAVNRSGNFYTCIAAHTSSYNDKPGVSIDTATYWTPNTETALTLDSAFPLPAAYERGLIAILAVEFAPMFGMQPSPFTMKKASEGETALLAAFLPIQPVNIDAGLTRMPSQIWPYNVGTVS